MAQPHRGVPFSPTRQRSSNIRHTMEERGKADARESNQTRQATRCMIPRTKYLVQANAWSQKTSQGLGPGLTADGNELGWDAHCASY